MGASLLDKRFLIVSGKGGVGKTTVAAAAAVAAAKRGKRVAILELGEHERVPPLFGSKKAGYEGARLWSDGQGVRGRPAGERERAQGVRGGPPREREGADGPASAGSVTSFCLTPREALHEFVIRQVRFERIYEAVFENRIIKYFTTGAPGLDELVVMGKIENLEQERMKNPPKRLLKENGGEPPPRFDLIVFDAPATGHGLGFFKVPQMTMRMTRLGPFFRKAERMHRLLTDPERTALAIVTLAEEMPVNETVDLHQAASDLGLPPGKLVVNGLFPALFDPEEDELLDRLKDGAKPKQGPAGAIAGFALASAVSARARQRMHEENLRRLEREVPLARVDLPFLFRPRIGVEEIELLAGKLKDL